VPDRGEVGLGQGEQAGMKGQKSKEFCEREVSLCISIEQDIAVEVCALVVAM
jgi:hypothetical protein